MSTTHEPSQNDQNRIRVRCRFCNKLNSAWENDVHEKTGRCRKCKLILSEAPHKKWDKIDPHSYIHPLDQQALQTLKAIPGIDIILKKLISFTSERMYRVMFKANSVRVSRDQCPSLDRKLDIVCETLGVDKPELYVSMSNGVGGVGVNAFTTGVEKPFIVLYSGLVERLTDEELLAVLAHEMGHIHCEHLLYKACAVTLQNLLYMTMARTPIGSILSTVSIPIQMALLLWSQKAELSCDRTALMVVQDERVVMSALTKLAGGVLTEELNLDAFINQAHQFEKDFDEDLLNKIWTLILASKSTHPFPVWRISEILKWSEDTSDKGYPAILKTGKEISV